MTDQELGYILYKGGVPQKDISKILQKSEVTIVRWKKIGEWDTRHAKEELAKTTAFDNAMELLNYQLAALKKTKEKYESEGGTKLISKGDLDGIRDLFNVVKDKQLEWTTVVKIIRELNKYLVDTNAQLAADAAQALDDFLIYKRKQLRSDV